MVIRHTAIEATATNSTTLVMPFTKIYLLLLTDLIENINTSAEMNLLPIGMIMMMKIVLS